MIVAMPGSLSQRSSVQAAGAPWPRRERQFTREHELPAASLLLVTVTSSNEAASLGELDGSSPEGIHFFTSSHRRHQAIFSDTHRRGRQSSIRLFSRAELNV